MRYARVVALALCVIAAARLLLLFIERAAGVAFAKSFKMEAAATVLVAAGAVAVLCSPRSDAPDPPDTPVARIGPGYWLGFVLCAVILYWPALSLGFLSDDFGLIALTDRWMLGAPTPSLFRPAVMCVWAGLRQLGSGPFVLHLWAVVLHGTAAFLVVRLATVWLRSKWASLAAGAVFLALPVNVEPVSWISGGFDVTMTVLALLAIETARRYGDRTSLSTRILFISLIAATLLSKETGVVAAAIILIDAAARRALGRPLLIDATACLAVATAVGLFRLYGAGMRIELSKYIVQRGIFQTFGGFAQEWPSLPMTTHPWQAVAGVAALTVVLLLFVATASRRQGRVELALLGWIAIAVAPVFAWIGVSQYLEGSRYLYLAAPAWAMSVVWMASAPRNEIARRAGAVAVAIVVVMSVWATRVQLLAWTEAASLRDAVLTDLHASAIVRSCGAIDLADAPDNVRGAFVFRNSLREALVMSGLPPMTPAAPPDCRLRWNDARRQFEPLPAKRP